MQTGQTVIDSQARGRGDDVESKGGKTHFITVNGKEKKARKDFL